MDRHHAVTFDRTYGVTLRLLDVTEFYSIRGGGVRSHLTQKGHVSCQLGHPHTIVVPGPADRDEEARGRSLDGPTILHVGGPSLPYDPTYHLLWRVDRIRRAVSEARPDVLEIHSPYLAAAAAMSVSRRTYGIRTFVWHADFIDTYLRGPLESRVGARATTAVVEPLWAWVRRIGHACHATFAASRWQRDKLEEHGVPRVRLLPFGVEKDVFRPSARDPKVREELLAGRPGPLLVGIGRFAIEKRWDVMLEGFARHRATGGAGTLVILGDGPEREALRARAQREPALGEAVTFLGFERDRDRLAAVLASADALLHACPYETFGLGLAEAVACGTPIVVPDLGGAAEQATPTAGETYTALDEVACAAALRRLLERPPALVREAALEAAARVPSVDTHFRQLFTIYEELLATR